MGAGVDGLDECVSHQLNVVVCIEALVMDVELGLRLFPAQVVFGQQRALVGALGLLAYQHHLSIEAFGAQCLGGLGSGQACADDDDCLV